MYTAEVNYTELVKSLPIVECAGAVFVVLCESHTLKHLEKCWYCVTHLSNDNIHRLVCHYTTRGDVLYVSLSG